MSETLRLGLPLLAAAQAQKHITHNEALLHLDTLMHLHLRSRSLASPPSALEGEAWLIAGSATGGWEGHEGQIAIWRSGAWVFFQPTAGLIAHVGDEALMILHDGSGWRETAPLMADVRTVARTPHGAETRLAVLETELSGLSGSHVDTPPLIPNRAVVFGVSCRTITQITGAASYDCGLSGEPSKFGGSLGVAEGASNAGVIGPTAFYAETAVRLTANGGAFSGGAVRIAVHCLLPVVPQS